MTRPSSGGFILGFAAEIAIVIAAISILPRIDLSGGQHAPVGNAASPLASLHETAHFERQPEPPAQERLYSGSSASLPNQASLPPRLSYAPQPTAEPSARREPPPLIAVDPNRPAYVEQRLDRASQNLVNGVGSYMTQAAERFLPPSPSQQMPYQPPQYQPAQPPASFAGSFATQGARPAQPRPWTQY